MSTIWRGAVPTRRLGRHGAGRVDYRSRPTTTTLPSRQGGPSIVRIVSFNLARKTGTRFYVNGKQVGETIGGLDVFNAAMHIWLGADPADWRLKEALLGRPVATAVAGSPN